MTILSLEADYVIIGAGTSGSVLAGLLAESGKCSVAVLEAGPMDSNPWIHIPIGFFKTLQNPRINWGYEAFHSEPPDARRTPWPRGRVVGGSGSINGLVYIQGQREDFDDWEALAGSDWGWASVARRYKVLRERGMVSGPTWQHALVDAFIESANSLGYPTNPGFNGGSQLGAGYHELNTHKGLRASSARRFLHPALKSGKINLLAQAMVQRLEITDGRVTGVRFRRNGKSETITARREVILCAGSIATPQIMQASGLGPAEVLRKAGIEVVRDMPQVGQNLRDHFAVRAVFKVDRVRTLNDASRSLVTKAMWAAQFALARKGPLSIGAGVGGLFAPVLDTSGRPDTQILMGPLSASSPAGGLHRFPAFTMTYCQNHPRSSGRIEVVSPETDANPKIVANYLSHEHDQNVVYETLRLARRLADQPALKRFIQVEHLPGKDVQTRDEVVDYARQYGATVYHPSCSVSMGDETKPVTPDLRVRGIEGLRVADAAAMPQITSGNINAVCAMIGVAASEFILKGL